MGIGVGTPPTTTATSSRAKSPCFVPPAPEVYVNLSHCGKPPPIVTSALYHASPWFPLLDHSVVYVEPPSAEPCSSAVPMVAPYMLYWKLTVRYTDATSLPKLRYMLNSTPG